MIVLDFGRNGWQHGPYRELTGQAEGVNSRYAKFRANSHSLSNTAALGIDDDRVAVMYLAENGVLCSAAQR